MKVVVVETPELGDRSYVVGDTGSGDGPGASAVVIDPQRDLDRIDAVLDVEGWTCVLVLETHLHNDYVSGGLELARRTGATYVVQGHEQVAFERHPVVDGDVLVAGGLQVRVVETPGHTEHHVAYVIGQPGQRSAVFTGGSLLYGSVGRTDLVHAERTEALTHAQYHSARRLADLPPDTAVYPTHGFGSMCSAGGSSEGSHGTIGAEQHANLALTEPDEARFVTDLIAGLSAYPAYYAHMGARNAEGPGAVDLSPPAPVDAEEIGKRIAAGEWVVDLRDRTAYAAEHLAGSFGFALGPQFSTYLGWLIPWGTPITLIGASPEQVAEAQRQLVRIGIERPAGAATGSLAELAGDTEVRGYPRRTFADLATHLAAQAGEGDRQPVVLDVRGDDERAAGRIAGSSHIPLHNLLARLGHIPPGRVWVHCAGGFRASIAASLLDRAGVDVVLIDDEWANATEAGLA